MILRKPGPLTVDEYAIVKEHGALGDSIVRDVPWPGDGRPLRRVWTPQASVA